jgi:hypothetical protein
MAWACALGTEIVRRGDEALTKVVLPEPVHEDPCQQVPGAVIDVGHPLGEGAATAGVAGPGGWFVAPTRVLWIPAEDLKEPLGGDAAFLVGAAAGEEMGLVEEVGSLRVHADGRVSFGADQDLGEGGFRSGPGVRIETLERVFKGCPTFDYRGLVDDMGEIMDLSL